MRKFVFAEDEAIADVAIDVEATSLNELFIGCAEALMHLMIENTEEIEDKKEIKIEEKANSYYLLLYKFLNDLIYYKDAYRLIFSRFSVRIDGKKLRATCKGDELGKKYKQIIDVKAVTMHNLYIRRKGKKYFAHFVVDV